MQLKLGEKNKLNKIDEIKFSSEVAETLGINAAIILRYIQDHDAGIISDLSFFSSVRSASIIENFFDNFLI